MHATVLTVLIILSPVIIILIVQIDDQHQARGTSNFAAYMYLQESHYCLSLILTTPRLFFFIISGVGLSPLGTAATSGPLYKPQMIDEGDCGATGGMKIGRGN
jgi:hypothetical protein